jgi:hypothetical protein
VEESSKLYARFLSKSDYQLVEIIEASENYTSIAIAVASEIIQERNLEENILKLCSTEFWKEEFKTEIKSYLKNQDIPKSKYLLKSELKELMKLAYEDYLQKRESMSVDSTKYWFV